MPVPRSTRQLQQVLLHRAPDQTSAMGLLELKQKGLHVPRTEVEVHRGDRGRSTRFTEATCTAIGKPPPRSTPGHDPRGMVVTDLKAPDPGHHSVAQCRTPDQGGWPAAVSGPGGRGRHRCPWTILPRGLGEAHVPKARRTSDSGPIDTTHRRNLNVAIRPAAAAHVKDEDADVRALPQRARHHGSARAAADNDAVVFVRQCTPSSDQRHNDATHLRLDSLPDLEGGCSDIQTVQRRGVCVRSHPPERRGSRAPRNKRPGGASQEGQLLSI